MNDEKAVSTQKIEHPVVADSSPFQHYLDTAKFEHLQRVAKVLSQSDLVPDGFRGKHANCFIACQMAIRCGIDPYTFLQGCYVVHGRPGVETKIAVAMLNRSGVILGTPRYEITGQGDSMACTCSVTDRATGEEITHTIDMMTAKREGWTKKSGSKWVTDPHLMLQYRAAMRLIRLHYPDVLLGMYSREELEDMTTVEGAAVSTQKPAASKSEHLTQRLRSAGSIGYDPPEDVVKPKEDEPEREPGDETEDEKVVSGERQTSLI